MDSWSEGVGEVSRSPCDNRNNVGHRGGQHQGQEEEDLSGGVDHKEVVERPEDQEDWEAESSKSNDPRSGGSHFPVWGRVLAGNDKEPLQDDRRHFPVSNLFNSFTAQNHPL